MDQTANLAPLAVLTASLLGSAHCAGMCGPFTMLLPKGRVSGILYHFGRFVSYSLLGAFAGLFGKAVFQSLPLHTANWISAILMAAAFVVTGTMILLGRRLHLPRIPILSPLFQGIQTMPDLFKSFATGLFSVLLPCGWLYGFVLGAAATGSPIRGAVFLTAFWLGTIPALVAARSLIRFAPKLVALSLIVFGLVVIGMRLQSEYSAHSHGAHGSHHHH